jgi:hypothetical protein
MFQSVIFSTPDASEPIDFGEQTSSPTSSFTTQRMSRRETVSSETRCSNETSRPPTLIEGSGFIGETIHQQSHFSTQDIDQSERPLSQ